MHVTFLEHGAEVIHFSALLLGRVRQGRTEFSITMWHYLHTRINRVSLG